MKKLILLLVFVAAFNVASKAYDNPYTLHVSYADKLKIKYLYGVNCTFVSIDLQTMCDPYYNCYTYAQVTLYGAKMKQKAKYRLEIKTPKGTYTAHYDYKTLDTDRVKTMKLEGSGQGVWDPEKQMKFTFSSDVTVKWQ